MNWRIFLALMIVCALVCSLGVLPARSQNQSFDPIFIKPDGSVEPSSAPIQQINNFYVLTANIHDPIIIERDYVVLDGDGHWLQNDVVEPPSDSYPLTKYSGIGVNITSSYVTIRNLHISNWKTAILGAYDNNNITETSLTNNYEGIKVCGNDYNIEWNYIANNQYAGILLRSNSTFIFHNDIAGDQGGINIAWFNHLIVENNMSNVDYDITGLGLGNVTIYRNNFFKTDPNRYLFGLGGDAAWDNGFEGNYWEAYNGTDTDNDGIGDTPFELGQVFVSGSRIGDTDYRPLMRPITVQDRPPLSPIPTATPTPTVTPTLTPTPTPTQTPLTSTPTSTTQTAEPSSSPQQSTVQSEQPTASVLSTEVLLAAIIVVSALVAITIIFTKRKSSHK